MRKLHTAIGFFVMLFLSNINLAAQTLDPAIGNLIQDAIYFTDHYITPATDAAVYQAASSWVNTPQKAERWDFTLGIHMNTFLVPKSDRSFRLNNSDLSFFQIENQDSALTPTALGSNEFVTLKGVLGGSDVILKSPEGVDRDVIIYPYLQGALGIGFGTELIAKFSPQITLKNVQYQVYGLGLKHSISQYFQTIESKNFFISTLVGYAREDLTVNFLDVETQYGNLGFNALNSLIDTWQFQINASKKWNKFELSSGIIANTSSFEYKVKGKKGKIEEVLPLQNVLNNELKQIANDKFNCIGEIAGRLEISRFFVQTTIAFGKFVNSNIALQYKF
ncbi:DUF6588 domain-containing protein [Flavobacterium antarcticum]|uniref:DUF6588 family protein n=1 Tax=Flavobacterium antarcticum TaxID=271155 RepID=UPI0003F50DE6|nr:DUF6588 family protein [Flavobacterium antarcticum]